MRTVVLTSLREALGTFVAAVETQSQRHIKPLHLHLATRLVLEGGFRPKDVYPRPPLRLETRKSGGSKRHFLIPDPSVGQPSERTVLGGLKTKEVDVVVDVQGLGPCIAVSVKGTLKAFRNLTNRMEEAAGDCTNLHLVYPALVYGFVHVLRATGEEEAGRPNDVAVDATGNVVTGIVRYHDILTRLTGRANVRNEPSRYEVIAMALIETTPAQRGAILSAFPQFDSPLRYERFFDSLLTAYDLRFVYAAPALEPRTARLAWDRESPAVEQARACGFEPRFAD